MDQGKTKAGTSPETEEKTFAQKISDFIIRNRKAFFIVIASILVILAGVGIYEVASSASANKSARAMEIARAKIATWNSETDETKKTELETALVAELDAIAKKWPRSFAAQQALYTKAGLYLVKKDWENAEKSSLAAFETRKKSYLAPFALENAAVAAEEQGKTDDALARYKEIVASYKVDNPNLAHAMFSIGRLEESRSGWKAAIESYENLIAADPSSDWALLAKNRVIFIKSQGLDQ